MSLFHSALSKLSASSSGPQESTFLDVLHQPSESDHSIDIVFVHGLNPWSREDHAYSTWTHTESGTLWPKDLLPLDIKNARIMLYGYNSNVAFNASNLGLEDHAYTLLDMLSDERDDERLASVPIIFVGHSLGGLVIKQALVLSKNNDRVFGTIKQSTKALVFFGTPHRGGNGAVLGEVLRNITIYLSGNERNEFLAVLQKNSEFLTRLTADFRNQYEDYEFLSVVESRGARQVPMAPTSTVVVDRESAVIGLAGHRERTVSLDASHSEICRLGKGPSYKRIARHLLKLVRHATGRHMQTDSDFIEDDIGVSREDYPSSRDHAEHFAPAPIRYYSTVPQTKAVSPIGQHKFLRDIERHLEGDDQQILLVTGRAGVGKSRCLAEVARTAQSRCSVFWFSGSNPESLRNGFRAAGSQISKHENDETARMWDSVSMVQSWLLNPTNGRWCIFIDDAADDLTYSKLATIFPQSSLGRLIVANQSQNSSGTQGVVSLCVPELSVGDACELFFSVLGQHKNQLLPTISLLVMALGCHPGGIYLAASYLRQNGTQSPEEYLVKLRNATAISEPCHDIPAEILGPLSITLDSLADTSAGRALETFALLDAERISEQFLASCRGVISSNSMGDRFAFLGVYQFQPAKQTLLSLSLLEAGNDAGKFFLRIPCFVKDYLHARLCAERSKIDSVAQTTLVLLDSIVRSQKLTKMEDLHTTIKLTGRHFFSLSSLAHKEGLQLGEPLARLGLLVSLHHLKKAASLGFRTYIRRSFRAWVVRNRALTGEGRIKPSSYDEVMEILPIPARIRPLPLDARLHSRLRSPISSAIWKAIEDNTHISAVSEAWFTVKDEILEIARNSARGAENDYAMRNKVADLVDKGACEAILRAAGNAAIEYTSTAEFHGTVAHEALNNICAMIAHNVEEEELSLLSDDELAHLISDALGTDFYSLFWDACRAWTSVLENPKKSIASMIESLANQAVDPEGLPNTVSFIVQQLANQHIRRYTREIMEATWEAVSSAGIWIAICIKARICLSIATRAMEPPVAPWNPPSVVYRLVDSCMELLVEATMTASPMCSRNWEWTALVRDATHHCVAVERARRYSGLDAGSPMPWERMLHTLQGDSLWDLFRSS